MVNSVRIANIALTPTAKIVLFFKDNFNIFGGVRSLTTVYECPAAAGLRSCLFWIITRPISAARAMRLWIITVLNSEFFQIISVIYALTIKFFLYQFFAISLIITPAACFCLFRPSVSAILFPVALVMIGFLLLDFLSVFKAKISSAISARAVKTAFIASRSVEKIKGCGEISLALGTAFCFGIHSFSPSLARLCLASNGASYRFSGATLDALRIIPLNGEIK